MELRQLEYFVAVAEEANFTRAAERVHISQSGVSAQIRRLEDELGATLLDRSGRRATLTTAGANALPHARSALASVDAMRKAVDDVAGLIRGRVEVGMVVGCRVSALFDALAAFHLDHPGVEIALREDNSDRLVDLVRSGTLDLALVAAAGGPPAGLDGFAIVRDRLVAGVPVDHPLARRRRVRLDQLTEYSIVCLPAGTGIRTAFEEACVAAGAEPRVTLEASAPDAVADLAARGLGIAVLSESTIAARSEQLRVLRIEGVDTPAVLAFVWASKPSPALDRLVECAIEAFDVYASRHGNGTSDDRTDRPAAHAHREGRQPRLR